MSEIGQHYHLDDYPATLRLLSQLLGHRSDHGDDRLGYRPTGPGAFVDWDRLTTGYLSSTEKGTVHIARGCSILERHGGAPPAVATTICDVVGDVI